MRKLISLLLFLLSALTIHAEIKVVSFTLVRTDMTADRYPVLGTNGKSCALVKVKTSEQGILAEAKQAKETPNETLRPQGLVRIEQPCPQHPDELWLYFTTETKRFRLMHPVYGLLADGEDLKNGYYLPQWTLQEGRTYVMEVELTPSSLPQGSGGTIALPAMPEMCEVKLESDDKWMRMKVDDGSAKRGTMMLVPAGEHTFSQGRFLNPKHRQKFTAHPGEQLTLTAQPSALPIAIFAGAEAAKPTNQSEMGYGGRLGIVGRWGVYGSFVKTWGESGPFEKLNKGSFAADPLFYYSDPKVCYQSWSAGFIVRCYSGIHVYAGAGSASCKVTWLKTDGKRYENVDETMSGLSYEAGALINLYQFYLSGAAECLDGNWVGRFGIGIYLKK